MRLICRVISGLLLILSAFNSGAFEPAKGIFKSGGNCAATVSIRGSADATALPAGNTYPVIGLNRVDGEYLQIRVADLSRALRWVRLSCGEWLQGETLSDTSSPKQQEPRIQGKLLLSISWQAAFCQIKPQKKECFLQDHNQFQAEHFTLHGLWPQPKGLEYCNVNGKDRSLDAQRKWESLAPLKLEAKTRNQLDMVMPGVQSGLDRHEWVRHGSCYGTNAETYYRVALSLLQQINDSELRRTFVSALGSRTTASQLKTAFEKSFGTGSGRALSMICQHPGERTIITELHIKLRQPVSETSSLREVLDISSPETGNCAYGLVDTIGLD